MSDFLILNKTIQTYASKCGLALIAQGALSSGELLRDTQHSLSFLPEADVALLVPSLVQESGGLIFANIVLIRSAEIVSIFFSKMIM